MRRSHGRDELVPVETIPLAFAAVRDGSTDFACVPIENSVEGAVPATLDALVRDEPVVAVAETVLDVRFSVLVRPGTSEIRTDRRRHPHALAQVREWIAAHLPERHLDRHLVDRRRRCRRGARRVRRGRFALRSPSTTTRCDELRDRRPDVADARTRFLLLRRPGSAAGADRRRPHVAWS